MPIGRGPEGSQRVEGGERKLGWIGGKGDQGRGSHHDHRHQHDEERRAAEASSRFAPAPPRAPERGRVRLKHHHHCRQIVSSAPLTTFGAHLPRFRAPRKSLCEDEVTKDPRRRESSGAVGRGSGSCHTRVRVRAARGEGVRLRRDLDSGCRPLRAGSPGMTVSSFPRKRESSGVERGGSGVPPPGSVSCCERRKGPPAADLDSGSRPPQADSPGMTVSSFPRKRDPAGRCGRWGLRCPRSSAAGGVPHGALQHDHFAQVPSMLHAPSTGGRRRWSSGGVGGEVEHGVGDLVDGDHAAGGRGVDAQRRRRTGCRCGARPRSPAHPVHADAAGRLLQRHALGEALQSTLVAP